MHASPSPPAPAALRVITVALIGNPNTGKSTLFNALAGLHARVGNYPGVTVEKKIGTLNCGDTPVRLVDLPGTYSLSPRSPDEMVSVEVLLGRQADVGQVDAVVCIVDASNVERNLYLAGQVLDLGLPTVLVLNMSDLARQRGIEIDVTELSNRLKVPIVRTEAHRRIGVDALRAAIAGAAGSPVPERHRVFPPAFYAIRDELAEALRTSGAGEWPAPLVERLLLDVHGQVESNLAESNQQVIGHVQSARDRLAAESIKVPAAEARFRYAHIRELLRGVVKQPAERPRSRSDRIDHVLTHRVWGLAFFVLLMFVIFQSIFTWAAPFIDAIKDGQALLTSAVAGLMPPGALRSLINDGVIAGVGGVIVFLPQIVMLFLFIAVLEDCGYMARAAFLMDRLMTKLGLSGKSFIPLMSSFACAVPGIMATRVIENRRDRMVTILVAPLMSCSARLPVYLLLIGAFIPQLMYAGGWISLQGLVLFGMTSLGALVAIPVAWILKKTFFRGETPPFVMELPAYRLPSLRNVLYRAYERGKAFVMRAGTLIFATSIVVWALGYFPGDHRELDAVTAQVEAAESAAEPDEQHVAALKDRQNELSSDLIKTSFLGRLGHAIEPAVRPLGWDWRIGVGALASFPAREVIIGTLGTIYSLGGDAGEDEAGLTASIQAATWPDGRKVYNVPVALSIMVFFALCAQCAATLMIIKRETNQWRWPIFTFVYMTGLAYVAALATYQVGMMFG